MNFKIIYVNQNIFAWEVGKLSLNNPVSGP